MFYTLLHFLFPSLCLACGRLSEPLCVRCRDTLFFRPHVRHLDSLLVSSGMDYAPHSLLEKLLHGFKYHHQADLVRYFIPVLRETLFLLFHPPDLVLVPVPLFPSRERDRGYNQAELFARALASQTGCRVELLLERARPTSQQALLSTRAERQANVQEAFRVKASAVSKDCPLVLIDDIVTSGSTLLACQSALQQAGYRHVQALTLADRILT
jgi:ComF family protein